VTGPYSALHCCHASRSASYFACASSNVMPP
jgi:hypothetical protein